MAAQSRDAKLWGGRFARPPAAEFERFSGSFAYDRRLAAAEIRGTRAHARALAGCGALAAAELAAIEAALGEIAANLDALVAGVGEPPPEDVHTFLFQAIERRAGAAARKLQTGRSRNEQVTLDLRLYLLGMGDELRAAFAELLASLAAFAASNADVLVPGYTHWRRGQPVSLGHHALAYAEMLLRDRERLAGALRRASVLPLGSGALAGTPWPVDRGAMAAELGLEGISQNSLDAVSDRDYAAELLFVFALLGVHLSRWAEDWILFSGAECGWLEMGDEFATGSSLMPQKKNPDALELLRGKSARQIGALTQILVLLKSLPLAYNRDLQEDKETVFAALDTALGSLRVAAGVVATTRVRPEAAAGAVADPALLATDLADLLVAAGLPFHDAHAAVGRIVAATLDQGRDFRSLSDAEWRALAPQLDPAAARALTAAGSAARRNGVGGTAPERVREQARRILELARE